MTDEIRPFRGPAPGTTVLIDTTGNNEELKKSRTVETADGRVLLIPQPSLTDPNDPLNWSTAKKWTVLTNGALYAFMGAVTGPIMAAGSLNSMPLQERS